MSRPDSIATFLTRFPEFAFESWAGWRGILARLDDPVRELWCAAGRGSGKSRISAVLAAWAATRTYRTAPGEKVYVVVLAPDRKQAQITHSYIDGLFEEDPELSALVESSKSQVLRLKNNVVVEVVTASKSAPRGRSIALAIIEESAFLPTDDSANPDTEILRAVRPGLARCPGSMLVVVGSPYARRGELWNAHSRYGATGGSEDGSIVYVNAPTAELNPEFDNQEIERAFREDPESAAAEYGGQFRSDVSNFLSPSVVADAIVTGELYRDLVRGVQYHAFVDPSGGSADSFTLAIAHVVRSKTGIVSVLDAVREIRPPFSPEDATRTLSDVVKQYGLRAVTGDRYAGEWPRERFRKNGVMYLTSERTTNEIYRDALPLFNSGQVTLLDDARLEAQLVGLERRTSRAGRDNISHPPGGHDDVANAVCGALLLASGKAKNSSVMRSRTTGRTVTLNDPMFDYGSNDFF